MKNKTVTVAPTIPSMSLNERLEARDTIGTGGTGIIKEVYDSNLRRTLVAKALKDEYALKDYPRHCLIEEAQITSQLDHPYIVPIYELGINDIGELFFTMKRIVGEELTAVLDKIDYMNFYDDQLYAILEVLTKVCDAVEFAHQHGVIHRDIKPANIMIGDFGQVFLMDWGAALLPNDPSSCANRNEHLVVGTPAYMPPEQTHPKAIIDGRADVYCLGGVLYRILAKRPPHFEKTLDKCMRKAREGEVVDPREFCDHYVYPALCDIAMKALAKDPRDRYQTPTELKQAIMGFMRSDWQFHQIFFAEGEVIVRQGDPGESAFIIKSGTCRAYKTTDGVEEFLRDMKEGDVFGETAVFANSPRTASVRAVTRVVVLEVTMNHFREHFVQEWGMGFWVGRFVSALTERFKEKDDRVSRLESTLKAHNIPIPE